MNDNPVEVITKILSNDNYTAAQQNEILKAVKENLINNLERKKEIASKEVCKLSEDIEILSA